MTHSIHFSDVARSARFRGVRGNLIGELFSDRRFETPLMLLSRSEVGHNFESLRRALPRAGVHYAVKSNNHRAILDELHARGGNFDVCSASEIESALLAGADVRSLVHTHPIKSIPEFDYAVNKGVETFVVDNREEIRKFARYRDRKLKVMVRFRVDTAKKAVVNLQYKFGCRVDDVLPLARMITRAGHQFYGLCFHIGSQCIHAENYVQAIETSGALIRELGTEGLKVRMLDVGGGFPVQYVEPVPDIEELCAPVNRALDRFIPSDVRVICEPGRFISASPVTLVCSVIGKAKRDGKIWYYLDDGLYSTFSGIVFDHCNYPVITDRSGEGQASVLAGPTCDSFDVMYDGLMIPEHDIGDTIVFPLTGAYCAVSGSDFNSLKRPDYIVID
jgi:ornithine decarboxylase